MRRSYSIADLADLSKPDDIAEPIKSPFSRSSTAGRQRGKATDPTAACNQLLSRMQDHSALKDVNLKIIEEKPASAYYTLDNDAPRTFVSGK